MASAGRKDAASHSGTVASSGDDGLSLRERYDEVRKRVAAAAARSGRAARDVIVVAVTKTAGVDQIRSLIEMGHEDFGENRVQSLEKRMLVIDEFLRRHRELGVSRDGVRIPDRVRWHMIGHLQRNKVRRIAGRVRLIHSVDSLRLVEELHAIAVRLEEPIELLVQVNVSGEGQKYGLAPAAAKHLVDQIDTMIGLKPRGLMCMAPLSENPEDSRPVFERAREIYEDIKRAGSGGATFDILSMGMSSDFEVGVECGSNLVRIGTAIFGPPMHESPDEEPED
jgi:pyridoxal phosphate enzyme (YggS family)